MAYSKRHGILLQTSCKTCKNYAKIIEFSSKNIMCYNGLLWIFIAKKIDYSGLSWQKKSISVPKIRDFDGI